MPIHPQKMRIGRMFHLPEQPFFVLFLLLALHTVLNLALSLRLFTIGQQRSTVIALVLRKGAIFHCVLERIERTLCSRLCLISDSVYQRNIK